MGSHKFNVGAFDAADLAIAADGLMKAGPQPQTPIATLKAQPPVVVAPPDPQAVDAKAASAQLKRTLAGLP
jgi:hypothetical protein